MSEVKGWTRSIEVYFDQGGKALASLCCSAISPIASLRHSGQRQSWSVPVTNPTGSSSAHQHVNSSLPFAASRVAPQGKSLPQFEQFFCIVPVPRPFKLTLSVLYEASGFYSSFMDDAAIVRQSQNLER